MISIALRDDDAGEAGLGRPAELELARPLENGPFLSRVLYVMTVDRGVRGKFKILSMRLGSV